MKVDKKDWKSMRNVNGTLKLRENCKNVI